MQSHVREYQPGAVIFREGDPGNAAFILTEGDVEISIHSGDKRAVVSILHPVAVFGEMALILPDQKRTATATARTRSKVAEISRRDFLDFLEQSPKLITAVLNALVDRLQKTTAKVSQTPDLFLGTCEMLNLVTLHSRRQIELKPTIEAVSRAFLVPTEEAEEVLKFLETVGMIDRKRDEKHCFIDVLRPDDFLARARLIHDSFTKMGLSPKSAKG